MQSKPLTSLQTIVSVDAPVAVPNAASILSFSLLTASLYVFLPAPVKASETERLQTISVIATIAETGKVEHEEFTGSHKRIEPSELIRRDVTLAEIVAHESGVQSLSSGGFGTFSSITMRAATAAQTGVYLDGVLLNGGGNAVIDLSLLDLVSAESVDIYRGATPVQLGVGSIGGAVNISTPSAKSAPATRALLRFGSFNTEGAQVLHRAQYGLWDVVGALSLQQSDNNYPFVDSNGTPLNSADDNLQLRNNGASRRLTSLLKAGLQWSEDSQTDFLLQTTSRQLGIPEWRNLALNQANLDTDSKRLHISHRRDGIGNWNSKHTFIIHNESEIFDDRLSQIGLAAQHEESINYTYSASAYWEYLADNSTSSVHVEFRNEVQDNENLLAGEAGYRVKRQQLKSTLQSLFYFADERLMFAPSLNLLASDDQYDRISRVGSNNRSSQVLSPNLGVRFNASDFLAYRLNLGRFYREPSFDELFGSRGLFRGNNNLEPEEGINVDLGFSWTPDKNLEIDASLFASFRDELIATVFDARGVGRTLNVGKARILGAELSANWRINQNYALTANLTVQNAEALREFDAFDGKQLPGEASQSAYLRLTRSTDRLRLYAESDGTWNRFYDQANVLPAKDRWLQNVGAEWALGAWSVRGAINNIGDKNFEDFNGLPRPGRSFTVSLSTQLQ